MSSQESSPLDSTSLEEIIDYDANNDGANDEAQQLVADSHRKALPVNVLWMISAGLGVFMILWAFLAAICNRRLVGVKNLPYIGFLIANLLVLLVVEIPDVVIFTTGQSVHNEWTKFVYDTANNIPLFNLGWIGIQNVISVAKPDWLTTSKSLLIGLAAWLSGILIALPFSVAFTLIDNAEDYTTKFIPLFVTSFLVQKALPLGLAVVTTALAVINMGDRIKEYTDSQNSMCCRMLCEKQTRCYIIDLISAVIFTFVWISEDVHVLIYLFNGTTLGGLELYHIAIYNLIETTAILTSVFLIVSTNDTFRKLRSCCTPSETLSADNLLAGKQNDAENGDR